MWTHLLSCHNISSLDWESVCRFVINSQLICDLSQASELERSDLLLKARAKEFGLSPTAHYEASAQVQMKGSFDVEFNKWCLVSSFLFIGLTFLERMKEAETKAIYVLCKEISWEFLICFTAYLKYTKTNRYWGYSRHI